MAPEQASQTGQVSPIQSTTTTSHPREASPVVHQAQNNSNAQPPNGQSPYVLYPNSYGQPFAPYSQQQQMQGQNAPQQVTYLAVPHALQRQPEKNSRKIARDILHVLVLIISIIGIGFSFSLLARSSSSLYSEDYDIYLPALSAGPVFILAFLWSLAELIVRCARKWKAGIHPGAHVGVCLCLWIGAVIVGSLLAAIADYDYYGTSCREYRYSTYRARRCRDGSPPIFIGSTALVLLLALVEIVIFIIACVDTHIRNRWRRNIVIASTPYWAPPPQGFHVPPNGQGQQPQFMPMGQQQGQQQPPPMMQQAPVQQPMMAHTRSTQPESQPIAVDAEENSKGKAPVEASHGVKEFYTPGPGNAQ
ncbi:hypothetical protein QQS21_000295 [Conoideocrella luteorostrata]|uniref:Uncharacterized protein n=1 Tax=Conoideocrella luteorostrata TaxID=1105319 RepID=A0AAJ0CZ81_9HYPO|nr:hypothetical protein QQS21_000295 [Conoideocrella luteorostrata]